MTPNTTKKTDVQALASTIQGPVEGARDQKCVAGVGRSCRSSRFLLGLGASIPMLPLHVSRGIAKWRG